MKSQLICELNLGSRVNMNEANDTTLLPSPIMVIGRRVFIMPAFV